MGVSFANVTPTNMELTPMRVTFDGVDLGGTLGNVVVSTKFAKAEIKADQLGTTVLDRRVSGIEITVTTELTEVQNKDILKVVFPHMVEASQGGQDIGYFQSMIGDGDLSNAKQLILHPLSKPDADLSENYLFYKACASAESEITYGPEEQARLKIVWNILPDTGVQPARFYLYGNPGVGLVSATASAPSFAGTGNGTMTGVSVFNGATLTEVITAELVTEVADGGVFHVEGSLSGSLGLATVGLAFVSPVIAFTINDGSTDFDLGDTFTVNTVAANYA